ncbi:MAG: hypothetical protein WC236_14645 [Gallionellaceae bacterium]|jgi:hypothetical protein
MSRVTIVLEDNEEGTVNQTVSYEMDGKGGFDEKSQSHQYSRVMLGLAIDFAKSNAPESKQEPGIILLG